MIRLKKMGQYRLLETKHNTKVLSLDDAIFAWVEPAGIGEILVTTHSSHTKDCVLSVGHYRLYEVEGEPELSDQPHLELETGRNLWQGYLLPTGLPDDEKIRSRIIPTSELVTGRRFQEDSALQHGSITREKEGDQR